MVLLSHFQDGNYFGRSPSWWNVTHCQAGNIYLLHAKEDDIKAPLKLSWKYSICPRWLVGAEIIRRPWNGVVRRHALSKLPVCHGRNLLPFLRGCVRTSPSPGRWYNDSLWWLSRIQQVCVTNLLFAWSNNLIFSLVCKTPIRCLSRYSISASWLFICPFLSLSNHVHDVRHHHVNAALCTMIAPSSLTLTISACYLLPTTISC